MKNLILIALLTLAVATAKGTIIDIFVDTDKETYQLDEDVAIFITAYNPNPESVTLGFGSAMTADYTLDDQYVHSDYAVYAQTYTEITIEPYSSFVRILYHDDWGRGIYPLVPGVHTIVGAVPGYGSSAPLEFTVVPEPATLCLFALGTVLITSRRKKNN